MTELPSKLLVATGNAGKVRELAKLLPTSPVELFGFRDALLMNEVAETGSTFRENAILKATGYAQQSGLWSLADDSGLEVDALGGRPGVLSARYAGAETPYDRKIRSLLDELSEAGDTDRSARFVCSMAISDPHGSITFETTGVCQGKLANTPRGTNGFGYDPIFVPDGFEQTFGELDDEIKQQISHRARAAREIVRYLLGFFDV
ncbi:MAG TPA: RdgB/HAM1 family non-canonical purine NTP pyrophosphatase [Pyrinomonadaceae bacterium]|jgi:XTP/dITP diphosphohydrolase|nr:RdgB/HAM1 family non-canonical purine NTP pyrophosphatase [Pyrinomonadaceae bacterium]